MHALKCRLPILCRRTPSCSGPPMRLAWTHYQFLDFFLMLPDRAELLPQSAVVLILISFLNLEGRFVWHSRKQQNEPVPLTDKVWSQMSQFFH